MEQGSPSNLVLVSNLYANSGRWNIVEQVRAKIKQLLDTCTCTFGRWLLEQTKHLLQW
jgi:hypothetical protein